MQEARSDHPSAAPSSDGGAVGDSAPKVCLVTGAGQGIGRGVAEELVRRGWRVHVNVRSADKRAAAAEVFGSERTHGGDLAGEGTAARVRDAVVAVDGRLDAVVHAVGPYATAPLSASSVDDFRSLWQGNVETSLRLMEACRDDLRKSSGAWVFFGCAGLERWRARKVTPAYISAKAALLVAVRALALEEAPFGVRANMVSPGFVPHAGAAPDTLAQDLHEKIPIGRPAEMGELAGLVAWLVSDEATHVVGQNVEVAGGWML